jgi:hypothetical protein
LSFSEQLRKATSFKSTRAEPVATIPANGHRGKQIEKSFRDFVIDAAATMLAAMKLSHKYGPSPVGRV